jgi:uroporphyrinogen-III decarboxylase
MDKIMQPQERFYAAISGSKPDRVPTLPKIWLDLAAVLLGRDFKDVIEDPALAAKTIIEAAVSVGADGVRLFQFPKRTVRRQNDRLVEVTPDGTILGDIDTAGGFATRLRQPESVSLRNPLHSAFVQFWSPPQPYARSIEDIRKIVVPDKTFYRDYFGKWQDEIIHDYKDKIALIGDCGPCTLAYFILLRGMENALIDLIDNPAMANAAMEKAAAVTIEKGKFNIDSGLKILRLNDSAANMSVISPAQWRQFIMPHIKTVCDELHRYGNDVKIYCHICGNILPVIEDLYSAGLDCTGPLDPLGGFDCAQARQTAGPQSSLMGGVNTLTFINGSPEDILAQSCKCIQQAGKNGAYILGSGCALPRDSKKENLLALREAAIQYGTYSE